MKKVRFAGFFQELSGGMRTAPSLREQVSDVPHQFESQILTYLKSGEGLIASPGVVMDVLSNWVWRDDLAYDVSKYHMRLPAEFLQCMESNGWKVPGDINLDEPDIRGSFKEAMKAG